MNRIFCFFFIFYYKLHIKIYYKKIYLCFIFFILMQFVCKTFTQFINVLDDKE